MSASNHTETVQTYATYLRNASSIFLSLGARVVISSPTPTNPYENDNNNRTYSWVPTIYDWVRLISAVTLSFPNLFHLLDATNIDIPTGRHCGVQTFQVLVSWSMALQTPPLCVYMMDNYVQYQPHLGNHHLHLSSPRVLERLLFSLLNSEPYFISHLPTCINANNSQCSGRRRWETLEFCVPQCQNYAYRQI